MMARLAVLALALALSACEAQSPPPMTFRPPAAREVALLRAQMAEAERISRLSDAEVEAELARPLGEARKAPTAGAAPDRRPERNSRMIPFNSLQWTRRRT